jgi:hypothetical protein
VPRKAKTSVKRAPEKLRSENLPLIDKEQGSVPLTIGVLALQGDFDAHRRRLEELGAKVVLVKKPEQLDAIDGLVIPGGESGTFLNLLGEKGFAKLKEFVRVKPTFGTCAGAILLASEVENPQQAGLGAIDIGIRRNAYGRQLESSIREGRLVSDGAGDSARAWKCWRGRARIRSQCGREARWPRLSIRSCRTMPGSIGRFWNWRARSGWIE